ncbi:hypothetical protein B0H63DRAFT_471322 [Podospora didyma]|uniref:Uncharacterized protein n=1 Tax=Podospora didyma TaxID=330526 RepID=A0AAE0U1X9_9PEZI|nr:hypothetical protein B0H63DRAFT_471322 [Podospora didyma]
MVQQYLQQQMRQQMLQQPPHQQYPQTSQPQPSQPQQQPQSEAQSQPQAQLPYSQHHLQQSRPQQFHPQYLAQQNASAQGASNGASNDGPQKTSQAAPSPPAAAAIPKEDLAKFINQMDHATCAKLLYSAAVANADVADLVKQVTDKRLQAEAAQVLNFDKYADAADFQINQKYARMPGSKQWEAASDAGRAVEKILDIIVHKTKPHSSYGTKLSAMETMRKIFDSLFDNRDAVGEEIRNGGCYQWDGKFLQVIRTFTDDELQRLFDEGWAEKLRATVGEARGYCILKELQTALDIIDGEDGDGEGEGEDDGEGGEDE